jgi:hypothetical protein
MHLHEARLCLDCEELHVSDRCPQCASDAFAFVTRWVPASQQRRAKPPAPPVPSHRGRWVTGATGVIGVAVFAAFRLWPRRIPDRRGAHPDAQTR